VILTGRDIRTYIDAGKLAVSPLDPERLQQNGLDLVLDDVEGRPAAFGRLRFYLASTAERLALPDDLMAFVELRSSWARRGLLLPPTIVDAGFAGNLTLEIFAATRIAVPYGQPFAHLIFARCSGPADPYRGKYYEQSGITRAKPEGHHPEIES